MPIDCYEVLGFKKFEGQGPRVESERWRQIQSSDRLEEMRNRLLIRRDQAGAAIVDQDYVVGWIPPLTLKPEEVEKLLCTLTLGISKGCRTISEWQRVRQG